MFDYQPSEDVELFAAQLEHMGWATLAGLATNSEEDAPDVVPDLPLESSQIYDIMPQNDSTRLS